MSDEPNTAILAALSRLEAGQAASQQSVAALATRAELTQVRMDLTGRMDRLENALSDIRNDIGVNFGASDAVKRATDNTSDEVRSLSEMMSALVRKVRALETRVREITGEP
jgi:hypothetical protein